jgi:hypothetical protein
MEIMGIVIDCNDFCHINQSVISDSDSAINVKLPNMGYGYCVDSYRNPSLIVNNFNFDSCFVPLSHLELKPTIIIEKPISNQFNLLLADYNQPIALSDLISCQSIIEQFGADKAIAQIILFLLTCGTGTFILGATL